jgi:hypothetical protein
LSGVLKKHHDSVGRSPSIVMNFITANVDFDRCFNAPSEQIPLLPLTEGLPGQWRRKELFESYRQGIHDGVFFPALHGLTHFCLKAVTRELPAGGERAQLIRRLWRAQTPYIHWRMPWIGYEYWDPTPEPECRFLSLEEQRTAILKAAEIYKALFASAPFSACAPGYRANTDTRAAWLESGVRVVQNGPGQSKAPYLDEHGMLHTFRNVEIEPATVASDVVSIHSINFQSTLRDFRTGTLALLDKFLEIIEQRWPNVLYAHDADLFRIATEGCYMANGLTVNVASTAGVAK